MAFLIQIDAYDTVAAAAVTLRMASVDDERVCHLNGQKWLPVIDALPTFAYDFFGGEFGVVTTPRATFSMMTGEWPNFGRYALVDARMRLWHGDTGAAWGGYTLRFDGRVTADPEIEDQKATISFGVDDKWMDQPLLATYAGTGGIEGRAEQKGSEKPLAIGAPMGVPGVLLDPVKWIYQLSAYGAIESVDVPLERLARQFGSPLADHANYAALDAATVAAGQWATCKAQGLVRMGAPPYGKLCFLMKGDKGGADGWVRRPGAIIKRLADIAGQAAKVNETSVDALDAARPYDLSLYWPNQTSLRDAAQEVAASVNAVAGVSLTGELLVIPIGINSATLTLKADGSALPPVASVRKLGMDAPWWRLAIGAQPFYLVHDDGDYVTTSSPEAGATNDGNANVLTIAQKLALIDSEAAREIEYADWSTRATALATATLTSALSTLNTKRTAWQTLRNAISPAWNDSSATSPITRSAYATATSEYSDQLSNLKLLVSEEDARRATWGNIPATEGRPDTNATVSDNIIRNGNLAQGTTYWYINPASVAYISRQTGVSGVTGEPPYYWRLTNTASDLRANDNDFLLVTGGSRLFLSFSGRIANGSGGYFSLTIWEYDNAGGLIGTIPSLVTPTGTAWQSRSVPVTLNANTARIKIFVACGGVIGAYADMGNIRVAYTERDANVPVQVSIVGGADKSIAADYLGAVTGAYPVFAPTVLRNGASIKIDTFTTYAVTKPSDGTSGADGGTITLDNTAGSSTKGNVTPSAFASGSNQIKWTLETKVNGVVVDRTTCTLSKVTADPPVSGSGGGGGGGSQATMPANATISSNTTYAALSSSAAQKVTIATGQTLKCTLVGSYSALTGTGGRALTAKARYANNSSMTSPTDFGSSVTGTAAAPGRVVGETWIDEVAGSIIFSQSVTGLSAGDYWVDMQGITSASGKSLTLDGSNIVIEAV